MNKNQKGYRNRKKVIDAIKSKGYPVAVVEQTTIYGNKDAFGLFDLCYIAWGKTYWVQVTSNKPHTHEKYLQFYNTYNVPVIQIVFKDYKGVDVYEYFKLPLSKKSYSLKDFKNYF